MRQARIKGQGTCFYHCVSRAVDGRHIFRTESHESVEAEYFVRLMRRLERACCVKVLTYALMSNHFHILCKVPERRELPDAELLSCVEAGHGVQHRKQVAEQLKALTRQADSDELIKELKARYLARLFDVSVFIKELKGRFAQWYNRRHQRYGVLWAERFKSVLLESGQALSAVAAYIDLNPLRAGLCADPKDYRYCGYAEAVAKNSREAKLALTEALGFSPQTLWEEAGREYRKLLFRAGTSASKPSAIIDLRLAKDVVEQQNGEIALTDLLRCRIRYFTDGGIIGSRTFVQEQYARFKGLTGQPKRDYGCWLHGLANARIWVLRDLRPNHSG
jgi:putative transposase